MTTTEAILTSHRKAPSRRHVHRAFSPGRYLAWTFLIIVMFLTLFPFYWMLRTSFSNDRALFSHPNSLLPVDFTLGPYLRVLGLSSPAQAVAEGGSGASVDFLQALGNSVLYSSLVTFGQLLFCTLAAYSFARLRWPGRNIVFFVFLTALMIPSIFTILPNFLLIRDAGLLNTVVGMSLPGLFMSPFSIFFLRQFFLGVNRELEEAAKIDGAGHLRILFRIIVPLSVAPLFTLGILTYINTWNDYFWPLLVGGTPNSRVLTVALGVFKSQTPGGAPDWAGLMAATVMAAAPILLLFFIFARRIVDSIGFSGLR